VFVSVTSNVWNEDESAPNEERATWVDVSGTSIASWEEIKECYAPSSNKMLAITTDDWRYISFEETNR